MSARYNSCLSISTRHPLLPRPLNHWQLLHNTSNLSMLRNNLVQLIMFVTFTLLSECYITPSISLLLPLVLQRVLLITDLLPIPQSHHSLTSTPSNLSLSPRPPAKLANLALPTLIAERLAEIQMNGLVADSVVSVVGRARTARTTGTLVDTLKLVSLVCCDVPSIRFC